MEGFTLVSCTGSKPSIYDRALAVYVRYANGDLVRCIGQHSQWVQLHWIKIRSAVAVGDSKLPHGCRVYWLESNADLGFQEVNIYERSNVNQNSIAGLILEPSTAGYSIGNLPLDQFFAELILKRLNMDMVIPLTIPETSVDSTVEQLVNLFDKQLRYHVQDDQWELQGRTYFALKVRFFVSRRLKLQLCLPAFPCKSSNHDKVMGVLPDRGEEIALRRLHLFVQQVERIYSPGALISIISDGHVFSDCIGVDDRIVDKYGAYLKELNKAIASCTGDGQHDRVQFQSLIDLLNLDHSVLASTANKDELLNLPQLHHDLPTTLDEIAETCRRILIAGCQPSRENLRTQIDSQNSPTLALYRGFSRFMLEDLDQHPLTQSLSRSRRKKLAAKVSFEMILRNQAYSNFIELMFPDYLRLSIHAHNNLGPKFGIRLFDSKTVRAVSTLDSVFGKDGGESESDDDRVSTSHLLHIPTPWHNCVAQVVGDSRVYIVKYGIVKEALTIDRYYGDVVSGNLIEGEGAFVSLRKREG
ncbi:isocyanide synthase family protein [Aspergillus tanneri]|uniref:Spore wall maturation protein DIT1 n=1 Tax=Aspergillus tanneri TaxID=1220188 RepID=A0A5M9M8V2_9EURO|nr:uncharacterized protein ATNIH1004_010693 [Aspergillus tanneri]KAA8641754.1 hypothetical protein ATNIH1004_010693 [Aspergillus tanneri]